MLGSRGRVAVVAAAALAAGGAWWLAAGDDDVDLRAGSELVDAGADDLLDPRPPPGAYRIDYRVEGFGGDQPTTNHDRLWVRRPFESRLEVYEGERVAGDPDAVQRSSFGAFRAEGAEEAAVVVANPPGPGSSDVRVAAGLDRAVAEGRAEVVEHRRVLGRRCHVVRTAEPLASADLRPARREGDHADTCIDAQGLVLEELVVADGEPLLRRLAVDLALDPRMGDVDFEAGAPTLEVDQGGGFVGELDRGSRTPGRFFEPSAPEGFRHRGRFAVVPPQADSFRDPTRRGQRLTYVSDVWVAGVDVVVLDQGGTVGDVAPFPALDGVRVDLALGEGVLTYGQSGPAVVVDLGRGDFVRARGTVAPDLLVALLEGLEEVPGGELRLLEEG